MKALRQIISIGAALFVGVCLFESLFWSSHRNFSVDNLLFPFALLQAGFICLDKKTWRPLGVVFMVIVGWIILTDFLGNQVFRGNSIAMSMRWVKWATLIFIVGNWPRSWFSSVSFGTSVKILFLLFVAINIIMYMSPFGWGEQLSYFYAPKEEVILCNYYEFGAFRLGGTMQNPNNNCIVFSLFFLYFLSLDAKKNWGFIVICFLLIFLTQSRTGLIVSLLMIVLHLLSVNSLKRNVILIGGGSIALVSGLFFFRSTNLVSLFTGEAFQSNSWITRWEHYSVFFDSSMLQQVIGRGIVLNPVEQVGFHLDSEYLSILLQYGYVGMILWLVLIAMLVLVVKKHTRKFHFAWQLIILFFVFGLTNTVFLNPEVAIMIGFLLGAWLFTQGEYELDDQADKETE